jgi:hypothetical protein
VHYNVYMLQGSTNKVKKELKHNVSKSEWKVGDGGASAEVGQWLIPRYLGSPPSASAISIVRRAQKRSHTHRDSKVAIMAPASLLDLVSALPATEGWGPAVSTETMLDGVPFAPYSKADKLGRMADWTEGKDRERGGRQQYGNRNYRGM